MKKVFSLFPLLLAAILFLQSSPVSALSNFPTCTGGVDPATRRSFVLAQNSTIDLRNGNASWAFFTIQGSTNLIFFYTTSGLMQTNTYASGPTNLYIQSVNAGSMFYFNSNGTNNYFANTTRSEVQVQCVLAARSLYHNMVGGGAYPWSEFSLIQTYFDAPPPPAPVRNGRMYRDIKNIAQDATCYVIADDKTLVAYKNGSQLTYVLASSTYYLKQSITASVPSETSCTTYEDVSNLPSPFDFMTPFLHTLAIVSGLAIFWFAYKLILYPFFRKGV